MSARKKLTNAQFEDARARLRGAAPPSLEVGPPRCATCGTAVRPHRNDPCKCFPVTDGDPCKGKK